MKAMILAAGLGTRLGELTQHMPKCLVEVQGSTLLAHAINHVKSVGVDYVVINTHHFADQVERYIKAQNNFGITIHLSYEPELLETGGGLYNAREHFLNEPDFLMHNADIFHALDLAQLLKAHREHNPVATVLVMTRQASRYLVFDSEQHLVGRVASKGEPELIKDSTVQNLYAFSGIHVLTPAIFDYLKGFPTKFSIIDGYLEAAKQGAAIAAHLVEKGEWSDVGTPERLKLLLCKD